MMKKTKLLTFIIFTFILASCSNAPKQPTLNTDKLPTKQALNSNDSTTKSSHTQKTYSDDKFRFSFQYPNTMFLKEQKMSNSSSIIKQILLRENNKNDTHELGVNIYPNTYASPNDFKNWYNNKDTGNEITSTTKINVGKYTVIKTIEIDGIDSTGIYVYLSDGKQTINFKCKNDKDSENILLNQILPTFKFIKQN